MTSTSFVFTELGNTMKYGGGSYITLFSPSDVTANDVWGRPIVRSTFMFYQSLTYDVMNIFCLHAFVCRGDSYFDQSTSAA